MRKPCENNLAGKCEHGMDGGPFGAHLRETKLTVLPGTIHFTIAPAGPAPLFFRVLGGKP